MSAIIVVSPNITLQENELRFDFLRSAGPGGQNVNKVATAVQLRFDLHNSTSLPLEVKDRLTKIAGKRINQDGWLIIEAKRYRTQEGNRQDAVNRLVKLIQKAMEKPTERKPTKPSKAAKDKRLEEKKRRSEIKRSRRSGPEDW